MFFFSFICSMSMIYIHYIKNEIFIIICFLEFEEIPRKLAKFLMKKLFFCISSMIMKMRRFLKHKKTSVLECLFNRRPATLLTRYSSTVVSLFCYSNIFLSESSICFKVHFDRARVQLAVLYMTRKRGMRWSTFY